jgi:hypothetical protein
MKLLTMQSSPASLQFLPLRSEYSPQQPVFKHTSLDVTEQFSHPYKRTGKIMAFYVLIFKILGRGPEEKKFEQKGSKRSPIFNVL